MFIGLANQEAKVAAAPDGAAAFRFYETVASSSSFKISESMGPVSAGQSSAVPDE
jgi:hypothetical protein